MARKKDKLLEELRAELAAVREMNRVFGRSEYRRGMVDGLKYAVSARKVVIELERSASK